MALDVTVNLSFNLRSPSTIDYMMAWHFQRFWSCYLLNRHM